ncbi:putative ankyrin repeat protein RF_0381 [Microplitis mediator]|uniref:putative ankyrin repeat protein RF_0381 n=1 Tax=Microplitis mediator TaxID=375433 RepID=UPI002554CC6C|nr:putative ankyrin repeat protein RF_0381 [Microplitis mediator]
MDDQQKYSYMIDSIKKEHTQNVRDMIEEFGLSFCPLLDDGHELLSAAVERNQVEMVAYLLRKNAKVNSDREVLSPLQIAAMLNNTIIFKLLLEHGAKISDYNIYQNNSLIKLAVELGNVDIAKLIVEHKNFGKKYDQFLLHTAVKNDSFPMVTFLLEIGMDVNEYDNDRLAPIHHALIVDNYDILQLLLNYGADVNAKNKYGDTPVSMVLMLPNTGYFESSDIFGVSIFGNTQNKSKLDILLDNDADINGLDIRKYFPPIHRRLLRLHFSANGGVESGTTRNKQSIIKHIVKLRSRNAPLSETNNILLSSLLEEKPLDDYKKICELEMSKIITEKIPNSGLSLHNILSKNSHVLAAYAKNKNHETFIFSDEVSRRFPIYGSVIKLRFSKGLARKNLLEKSTTIFYDLFPVASKLLSNAVDNVFECLDNNDLRHFLRMFQQDN